MPTRHVYTSEMGDPLYQARRPRDAKAAGFGIRTYDDSYPSETDAGYRNDAFTFSSIAAPGHSSFSDSLLNGVSTVLRWA